MQGRRTTGSSRPRPGSRETLKRQKPQESIGLAPAVNSARQATNSVAVRSPEDGPSVAVGARVEKALRGTYANVPGHPAPADAQIVREADGKRVAGVERRYGCGGGKSSEGENPMSATGMKQGRTDRGRENRQEGAKP